jgi:hypothetical protein
MKAWLEGTPWTREMLARLEQLYTGGFTYSRIAEVISAEIGSALTRSAIAGMVQRLNLPRRGQRPTPFKAVEDERDIPPPPKTNTLFDLQWHDCKWPVARVDEQWLFCRQPRVLGRPYCPEHAKLSYAVLRGR